MLQFLIHHSGVVIYNVRPVLEWFFTTHLFRNGHFRTPLMAYETLLFCIRNRKALLLHTTVFEQFWPAIIKLLAWQPKILAGLVRKILASCLSPSTCVAIFETLLDLPILSAVLEGQLRDANVGPTTNPTERAVRCVKAQSAHLYRRILRNTELTHLEHRYSYPYYVRNS